MMQDDKAHSVFVRLVLGPYMVHFKSAGYMREQTLDVLDKRVCKETLINTAQRAAVRRAIGTDARFWADLCALLRAAIPSLERRSFTIWDPSSVDYESTSGALIASHYPGLYKDLDRLNDLLSIARNVLTAGVEVQDLAASYSLEEELARLINCCIRVTARGYDGDADGGDEQKWSLIVSHYKKLLITSLQFLNNFVAKNERRKLMLWLYLFDNPAEPALSAEDVPEVSCASLTDMPSNPIARPGPPLTNHDLLVAFGNNGIDTLELSGAVPLCGDDHAKFPPPKAATEEQKTLQGNGYALFVNRLAEQIVKEYRNEHQRDPTMAELHLSLPRRWAALSDDSQKKWQAQYEDELAKYRQDLAVYETKALVRASSPRHDQGEVAGTAAQQMEQTKIKLAALEEQLAEQLKNKNLKVAPLQPAVYSSGGNLVWDEQASSVPVIDDMKMLFTAKSGTKILESGKAELMKRLEGYDHLPTERNLDNATDRTEKTSAIVQREQTRSLSHSPLRSGSYDANKFSRTPSLPTVNGADVDAYAENLEEGDEGEEEDDDESEEEGDEGEEEEEDYPGSHEDGRGLLTDVPLILGPSEIEVLPMLIMSGIVPSSSQASHLSREEKNALINMHSVRIHLLLSQSNGRNLLRELLIFVAAWDLREDELYFKFMVKIMEAILKNGLMPYAYHAFRDRSRSKDIISPAQAVIMKLLTCIFRGRGEAAKAAVAQTSQMRAASAISIDTNSSNRLSLANVPTRVDLHILNFIFTEFRQHIIPQTCALIFLQGQIHAGRANPEDFPLNLWDMERMYEGVYQYLEFFAVLTEESIWKGILGEWEMASELVTLLRELEGGIPKLDPLGPQMSRAVSARLPQRAHSVDGAMNASKACQGDQIAVQKPFEMQNFEAALPPLPQHPPTSQIFEAETPLAYPEDPVLPLAHDLPPDHDEPSDFEWRNLKKLTVLVLSSLIWKNKTVQDQVRAYGGLEALVGCCKNDDNNPYIREHAIMCLRFAVEGSEENAGVIRRMAANQKAIESGHSVGVGSVDDVPREVLDTNQYETFMDQTGQVGLRRKEGMHAPAHVGSTSSSNMAPSGAGISKPRLNTTKLTAEKAAELMQNALRDLPIGDRGITDKQKSEALAKLDRAFESTERMLANGRGRRA